jgi:mRNA-degrading endonuclease RelE of RelBE toxin-antitoxin system
LRHRVRYTREAAGIIRRLHPQIKHEIRQGIAALLEAPLAGHALHFELAGLRSCRVRNHRIIYRLHEGDAMIEIIFIRLRRDVYEELRDLLLKQMNQG